MKVRDSSGGLVVNQNGKVLVVNQHNDSWSLPKGHQEAGETLEQAAIREIREESGVISLKLVRKIGQYRRHRIGLHGIGEDKTELKNIHIFLFTTTQQELSPQDADNPEAKWVDPDKVEELLTHKKDKEFFRKHLEEIKEFIA